MRAGIEIFPLPGLPEVRPGDDLADLIGEAFRAAGFRAAAQDVVVIAQKIVSKAEGRVIALAGVSPSARACAWAQAWSKDPRVIELVLRESKRILRMERGLIIAETHHGFVCANAGVDISNTEPGTAVLLPLDPDASARALQPRLSEWLGGPVGVIISDTFGRAWREGLVNVALGVAGVAALIDYRGAKDANGNVLQSTVIAIADELAAAAELVMGKADRVPAVLIRGGARGASSGEGRDLIRPAERDLFR